MCFGRKMHKACQLLTYIYNKIHILCSDGQTTEALDEFCRPHRPGEARTTKKRVRQPKQPAPTPAALFRGGGEAKAREQRQVRFAQAAFILRLSLLLFHENPLRFEIRCTLPPRTDHLLLHWKALTRICKLPLFLTPGSTSIRDCSGADSRDSRIKSSFCFHAQGRSFLFPSPRHSLTVRQFPTLIESCPRLDSFF